MQDTVTSESRFFSRALFFEGKQTSIERGSLGRDTLTLPQTFHMECRQPVAEVIRLKMGEGIYLFLVLRFLPFYPLTVLWGWILKAFLLFIEVNFFIVKYFRQTVENHTPNVIMPVLLSYNIMPYLLHSPYLGSKLSVSSSYHTHSPFPSPGVTGSWIRDSLVPAWGWEGTWDMFKYSQHDITSWLFKAYINRIISYVLNSVATGSMWTWPTLSRNGENCACP